MHKQEKSFINLIKYIFRFVLMHQKYNEKLKGKCTTKQKRAIKDEVPAFSNNINMLYLLKMSFIILERFTNSCLHQQLLHALYFLLYSFERMRIRLVYVFSVIYLGFVDKQPLTENKKLSQIY